MERSKKLYYWIGLNTKGEKERGVIEAFSLAQAKTELHQLGIMSKKVHKRMWFLLVKKIRQTDITIFLRQLTILIKAGISIIQSFDLVAKNQTKPLMKNLIILIKKDIETGLSLYEALQKHPNYFNQLICSLVRVGEQSGRLEPMLDKIASYKERNQSNIKKIKKALSYPLAVLCLVFLISFALLTFVIPQFQLLFASFDAELPALTRLIINLSIFFKSYWLLSLGLLVGLIYGFFFTQKHSIWLRHFIDKKRLKLPILGRISQNILIARFSYTLAITFSAGLSLVDALRIITDVMTNNLYAKATELIRKDISTGQPLRVAMQNTLLFPDRVIQLIAIGEESGTLEIMLSKIADFYEEEVNNDLERLTSLFEPVIMALLGLVVGGLVIAMYLPIFKLGSIM